MIQPLITTIANIGLKVLNYQKYIMGMQVFLYISGIAIAGYISTATVWYMVIVHMLLSWLYIFYMVVTEHSVFFGFLFGIFIFLLHFSLTLFNDCFKKIVEDVQNALTVLYNHEEHKYNEIIRKDIKKNRIKSIETENIIIQ